MAPYLISAEFFLVELSYFYSLCSFRSRILSYIAKSVSFRGSSLPFVLHRGPHWTLGPSFLAPCTVTPLPPLTRRTNALVFGAWACYFITVAFPKERALSRIWISALIVIRSKGETVWPFNVRLKEHPNTTIYRPTFPEENYNRASLSP